MTEILLATIVLTVILLSLTLVVMGARAVLAPSRPVRVQVNATTTLHGQTGDSLLSILNSGGVGVPSACAGVGTCGLCRVRIPEGGDVPLPTEAARLSRTELRNGTRLACQIVVRAPLSVIVPDQYLSVEPLSCTVSSTRMLAPLIKEIVLDLPPKVDFTPRAGAFVQIDAPPYELKFTDIAIGPEFQQIWQHLNWHQFQVANPDRVSRAYSMANRPEDSGQIVLTIRLALPPPGKAGDIPPGIVSSYLFGLNAGDSVQIAGPFGEFGAQNSDREMVFIGGGVGMAPLRAIIHDQLGRVGTSRKITYWYGARSAVDAFYTKEFNDLMERHENFSFRLALSDPEPGTSSQTAKGFVHEIVLSEYLRDHPAPESCEYYLCGPPLMIQAVRMMLDNLGVDDDMIYFDDFGG